MSEEEFTLSQQHDGPGEGSLPENSGEQWTLITICWPCLVSPEQSWGDRGDADHQWGYPAADHSRQRHHRAGQRWLIMVIIIIMVITLNIIPSTEA